MTIRPHLHSVETTPLTFKPDQVVKAARSFGKLTSGAVTGTRPEHIQVMLEMAPETSHTLTALVTHYANAGLPAPVRKYFAGGSLSGLAKPDNGVRPVACGELFRRLTAKVVVEQASKTPEVKKLLESVGQYGAGAKMGGDRMIHRARRIFVQHQHDSDFVVLKIDATNAFNLICRQAILDAVAKFLPRYYNFFALCYQEEALLRALQFENLGGIVDSSEGVQQGDPAGPLLFCLASAPVMEAIKAAVPSIDLSQFLDDGLTMGKVAETKHVLRILKTLGPNYGFHLNEAKCEVISHRPGQGAEHFAKPTKPATCTCGDPNHDLNVGTITTNGNWNILGSPIGDEAYCYSFATDTKVNAKAPLARVARMQSAEER